MWLFVYSVCMLMSTEQDLIMSRINLSRLSTFTRRGYSAGYSVIERVLMEISNWSIETGGHFCGEQS